jgi:hypothetical protein
LRTLLAVVTLVALAMYLRPGQVDARSVPAGASKLWVWWNCGIPYNGYLECDWGYDAGEMSVELWFDNNGRVESVMISPSIKSP